MQTALDAASNQPPQILIGCMDASGSGESLAVIAADANPVMAKLRSCLRDSRPCRAALNAVDEKRYVVVVRDDVP